MNRIADWIASHEEKILTDIAHDIFCHPGLLMKKSILPSALHPSWKIRAFK